MMSAAWRRFTTYALVLAVAGLLVVDSGAASPAARRRMRRNRTKGLTVTNHALGKHTDEQTFGKLADGTETRLFSFTNANGVTMKVTDYGARLVAVEVPDRNGKLANVTLGLGSGGQYEGHTAFFGCTTGRFANRIAKGKFTLDGKAYQLATNIAPNHLHGGKKGFDRYVWTAAQVTGPDDAAGVKFTLVSPDGDEGYPGTLSVTVTYLLNNKNEVRIDYAATTSKPTVLNLTNHAYWNLAGAGQGDILGHCLTIAADNFLAVDGELIPTGKLTPVAGTHMDFTTPHTIGERIAETKKGTPNPNGYDHCYVLRGQAGELRPAARAEDPASGRVMEVLTTEPAVQLYAGNFLDGDAKNGGYKQHSAFCLETQHFPDAPNHPEFPTAVLRPGETYKQTTVHRFSVAK